MTETNKKSLNKNTKANENTSDYDEILRLDSDLKGHLKSLSLPTVEAYIDWCRQNGFSIAVKKNWRERCREKHFATRHLIQEKSQRRKQEKRHPRRAIIAATEPCSSFQQPNYEPQSLWLKQVRKLATAISDSETLIAFRNLLLHLEKKRSGLLSIQRGQIARTEPAPGITANVFSERESNNFVQALASLSLYHANWQRPLQAWKPKSRNPRKQFSSLCRHLMAAWPIPTFMDCVWFHGDPLKKSTPHDWFIQLANGVSVRKLGLPIPLSKKMVAHFLNTPDGFYVEEAIRRAQTLALGGDESLSRWIVASRISEKTGHHDFWLSVIHWFTTQPLLRRYWVGPIVDYFQHKKFSQNAKGETVVSDFSVKGRTANSVFTAMREWHAELRGEQLVSDESWLPYPNTQPCHLGRNGHYWTIEQLLTSKELAEEGRKLKHCVLSYAKCCRSGKTTIWSLKQMRSNGNWKRAVTIEVATNTRAIRQIRGRCNRLARCGELEVIRQWARSQGFTLKSM